MLNYKQSTPTLSTGNHIKKRIFTRLKEPPPKKKPINDRTKSNPPSARHAMLPHADDIPPLDNNPLHILVDTPDSFLTSNSNTNHSNNAVNNHRMHCKSVTLNTTQLNFFH